MLRYARNNADSAFAEIAPENTHFLVVRASSGLGLKRTREHYWVVKLPSLPSESNSLTGESNFNKPPPHGSLAQKRQTRPRQRLRRVTAAEDDEVIGIRDAKLWVGRHPHCPFRGLLRLHSRYGPHACSTAQGGLCHGASTGPVARPRRPSATSSIDNSLGGTLLHRCFAPSRRTRVCVQAGSFRFAFAVDQN